MKIKNLIIFFTLFFIGSCSLTEEKFSIKENTKSIAVPLAYGSLTLQDVIDRAEGDAKLRIDGDGRITASYSGEILRENSSKIFPPVPGALYEFPILNEVSEVPLPIKPQYRIDKGIFDNVNIFFNVRHNVKEIVDFKIKIPNVKLGTTEWSKEFKLDFNNSFSLITSTSNLDKYVALPTNNKILFEYEATNSKGEKIKFESLAMRFDILRFSYLDGYFGNHTFDIKGDIIKINLFNKWKSGGVEFENPYIKMDVDNAFGFPVRSKVNQLLLKTVTNQFFNVESTYINQGINFAYPSINEVGQIKNTVFQFDSSNSNVGKLFQEKVVEVIYDFDALANPEGDIGIKNFFNSSAFFSVKVDVELPMKIKANDFTIADTLDFNLGKYDNVDAAELKFSILNNFPIDTKINAFFLDSKGNIIDNLSQNEIIDIPSASIGENGKTNQKTSVEKKINLDQNRFKKLREAKKILLTASFDSSKKYPNPIWLYNDYGLDINIGAIINVKL